MSLQLSVAKAGMWWIARPILQRSSSIRLLRILAGLAAYVSLASTKDITISSWAGPGGGLEFMPANLRFKRVLIWFHGGGYVVCSPRTHSAMLAEFARACQCRIIAPVYRLAPEHAGGAAFDDGLAACRAVLASGIAPADLVLAGDSAGGGLAAAVAAALCAEGCPAAGLIALSPWTDMTGSGASYRSNATLDVLLPSRRLAELVALVKGDLAVDDPRLSPAFARFPGLKRAYLSAGTHEILLDDMRALAARLAEDGAKVDAVEQPDAPHVLAFNAPFVPEARAEIARIAEWLNQSPV